MALPDPAPTTEYVEITPAVQLRREGNLALVVVAGQPWAYFSPEEPAAENFAMVSLVQGGLASVSAVAKGFNVQRGRIYRSIERYQQGGVTALVPHNRGPKGPRVLKGEVAKLMVALNRLGVAKTQIAARLGVTEGAVRHGLEKLGITAAPAECIGSA